jgi:hypothetical protein
MNNYTSFVKGVCVCVCVCVLSIYKGLKFCLCLCLIVKLPVISHPLSSAVVFNFFVRVPPDIISFQLCTSKVVGA